MGQAVTNFEFIAHANPSGGESQGIRLHLGSASYEESLSVGLTDWQAIRAEAVANDRDEFETKLQAAATPTGGWNSDRLDAAWRAARRCWA